MNITNNSLYYCSTSKNNPYIDVIVFRENAQGVDKHLQNSVLLNWLNNFSNAHPYMVASKAEGGYEYYASIMNELQKYPQTYNCTCQEFNNLYNNSIKMISFINSNLTNNTIVENMRRYGLAVLNSKFFKDVCNYKLNYECFISGLKKMTAELNRLLTNTNNITK